MTYYILFYQIFGWTLLQVHDYDNRHMKLDYSISSCRPPFSSKLNFRPHNLARFSWQTVDYDWRSRHLMSDLIYCLYNGPVYRLKSINVNPASRLVASTGPCKRPPRSKAAGTKLQAFSRRRAPHAAGRVSLPPLPPSIATFALSKWQNSHDLCDDCVQFPYICVVSDCSILLP